MFQTSNFESAIGTRIPHTPIGRSSFTAVVRAHFCIVSGDEFVVHIYIYIYNIDCPTENNRSCTYQAHYERCRLRRHNSNRPCYNNNNSNNCCPTIVVPLHIRNNMPTILLLLLLPPRMIILQLSHHHHHQKKKKKKHIRIVSHDLSGWVESSFPNAAPPPPPLRHHHLSSSLTRFSPK